MSKERSRQQQSQGEKARENDRCRRKGLDSASDVLGENGGVESIKKGTYVNESEGMDSWKSAIANV